MVENEASVSEVWEFENAEANKLGIVELSLGVAKGYEVGLELFEMVQMIASIKNSQDSIGSEPDLSGLWKNNFKKNWDLDACYLCWHEI